MRIEGKMLRKKAWPLLTGLVCTLMLVLPSTLALAQGTIVGWGSRVLVEPSACLRS